MLLDQVQTNLKQAQLARDEIKVSTLRLLLSEIKNKEIEKGGLLPRSGKLVLSDEDIVSVVQKEAKKRKEATVAFRSGGREDAALKEEAELKVLEGYLPAQMTNEELTKTVEDTITELGASGMSDMGKVIGAVMGKVKGRTDGALVSAIVKEKLVNV